MLQMAMSEAIKNGDLTPTSLINILTNETNGKLRSAMATAFENSSTQDFRKRVGKVAQALKVIEDNDYPQEKS